MIKTWFITGAARGIGACIARAALDAGDNVVATGRDPRPIERALPGHGERLLALRLDVTDPAQACDAVDRAVATFGRIDVLVNNAGYGQLGMFEENSADDVLKQFDTNVHGTLHVTRAVLPVMRRQRAGRIFNLSSIGGMVGFEGASIYCAAKFAVEGFSESLALEVARFGIQVTIVQPGFFRTDFLDGSSVRYGAEAIPDYVSASAALRGGLRRLQPPAARGSGQAGAGHRRTRRRAAGAVAFRGRHRCARLHRRQARCRARRTRAMEGAVGLDRSCGPGGVGHRLRPRPIMLLTPRRRGHAG
ncbi:hypothetical protein OJJOAM_004280 [Cupriavidus sp. H18C1]